MSSSVTNQKSVSTSKFVQAEPSVALAKTNVANQVGATQTTVNRTFQFKSSTQNANSSSHGAVPLVKPAVTPVVNRNQTTFTESKCYLELYIS